MKINVLTIFPKLFGSFTSETLIKKALAAKLFEINLVDIREYAADKHHTTDDSPYGGGPGMVMKVEPIFRALEKLAPSPSGIGDLSIRAEEASDSRLRGNGDRKVVLMSPRGRQFSQSIVEEYAKLNELTMICGRYEGVDQRVVDNLIDEELSIGPYVMSGGEIPAMVVIEAVSRYVPGVLGNEESLKEETFSLGKFGNWKLEIGNSGEYPHYTKPAEFNGWKVPEVLLSGNHEEIKKWREKQIC